jgi:hypothetical protein
VKVTGFDDSTLVQLLADEVIVWALADVFCDRAGQAQKVAIITFAIDRDAA